DDEKSAALFEFKRAVRQGLDGKKFLRDYLWSNGTEAGLKQSFQRMEPFYGLTGAKYKGYLARFLGGGYNPVTKKTEPGLTPEQETRIRSAYWYVSDLATPAVSQVARE